ncbi:MAG: hypothetical protein EA401_14220 [Planctomycetota bacterium]|nr:MAG: hypothetical protein EA401_14220 [Planctomycetota bacterium]
MSSANNPAQGFRSTASRTRHRSLPIRILGYFSTMWGAAFLLAALIVVVGVASYYERDFGREAVAVMIFQSWWFAALFALLALNIFGAAAVRYPWSKQQTGFVIVHCGLLTIMLGFVIAGNDRLDGMLAAPQGEQAHIIERDREILTVIMEDAGQRRSTRFEVLKHANYPGFFRYMIDLFTPWTLVEKPMVSDPLQRVRLMDDIAGYPVYLRRVVDTALDELTWEESHRGQSVARFTMTMEGDAFGAEAGRTRDIFVPRGQLLELSAAELRHHQAPIPTGIRPLLQRPDAEELGDYGRMLFWDAQSGDQASITIDRERLGEPIAFQLGESEFTFQGVGYQPHVVRLPEGGFDAPTNLPLAPMLVYRLAHAENGAMQESSDILSEGLSFYPIPIGGGRWAVWQHPTAWLGHTERPLGSSIDLMHLDDGSMFLLRASNNGGVTFADQVETGAWSHTTDMGVGGLTFAFADYWEHAAQVPQPIDMEPMQKDRAANWIEVQIGEGSQAPRHWIRRGDVVAIDLPEGGRALVRYHREQYDLLERHGFALNLQRFINEKDPGGQSNASYASVVRLHHADGRGREEHVISMNEPLKKGGVTLYQTARAEQPDGTFVSFFTVAQDPGRPFKYLGSLILVAGMITMYVMKRRRRRPPVPSSRPPSVADSGV